MRASYFTGRATFPCAGVRHSCFCAPADPANWYYAEGSPDYAQTAVAAFNEAGIDVGSVPDILEMGVYLTAAVKCAKTGHGIRAATINECSVVLEREIDVNLWGVIYGTTRA